MENPIADRVRQCADRIERLSEDVIQSFVKVDARKRVSHVKGITNSILLDLVPFIDWLERRWPLEKSSLLKDRIAKVLDEALACAGCDIPEYIGGVIHEHETGERASAGARRTATLFVTATMTAHSLRDWADDIEGEISSGKKGAGSKGGYLGGDALMKALDIHPTRVNAFEQQLARKRKKLGDNNWQEITEPRPNKPKYLYRADSKEITNLAAGYKSPKSG